MDLLQDISQSDANEETHLVYEVSDREQENKKASWT